MAAGMMYAAKFEYDTPTSIGTGTKIVPCENLKDAAGMFQTMLLARALAKPVRVRGGKTIDIPGTWFFEVDCNSIGKVRALMESGNAILMDESTDFCDLDPDSE